MASLIERRKIMQMVTPDNPYIKDGLVFWLDGKNIGDNDGYWTDLAGGRLFEMRGNIRHAGDRIVVTTGSFLQQTIQENYTLTGHTFEVCAKFYVGAVTMWLLGVSSSGNAEPIFVIYNNGNFSYTSVNRKLVTLPNAFSAPFTFSKVGDVDQSGVYINLSDNITYGGNDSWGSRTTYLSIGARFEGSNATMVGEVMSIRMYNRELTQAEVMHNQQADNLRFNLGL